MERNRTERRTVQVAAYRREWRINMTKEDANTLVDLGTHPEIYADGIGDLVIVEPNAQVLFFRWRKLDGILRRCIVAELIRPLASFTDLQMAACREAIREMVPTYESAVH